MGEYKLPLWKRHIEIIGEDDNCALLMICPYSPDIKPKDIPKEENKRMFFERQIVYQDKVREWVKEAESILTKRLLIFDKAGQIPRDKEHRLWIANNLGCPEIVMKGIDQTNPFYKEEVGPGWRSGRFDFFTIEFDGMYRNSCVDHQKFSFPSISVWDSDFWGVDKYAKELGMDPLGGLAEYMF